jgi:hypothetical protein
VVPCWRRVVDTLLSPYDLACMTERTGDPLTSRVASSLRLDGAAVRLSLASRPVAVVTVVAALAAAATGASPTGSSAIDVVLVVVAVALVVLCGSGTPWWIPLTTLGVATATSGSTVMIILGSVALAVGGAIAATRDDGPLSNVMLTGVAVNVLFRSDFGGSVGVSAVVGVIACAVVVVGAMVSSPTTVRRSAFAILGTVMVFLIVSAVGLAVTGTGVRDDASAAVDEARAAVNLLGEGDYLAAADGFDAAATSFGRVGDGLSSPLAWPARMTPVIAQNLRAGVDLSASAATTLEEAASALRAVDPASLRVTDGAIDLDAIRRAELPLRRVQAALNDLRATTNDVRSVWLVGRLTAELDDLEIDFNSEEPRLQNAIDAVEVAPRLLGGEGDRRYLVLFTTPAEARGLGGFVGNYAELLLDDGAFRVVETGRRSDLEAVLAQQMAVCDDCPDEFVQRYGRFGFNSGESGTIAGRAWSNVTMSPHFPAVAEVASILYPASGGSRIDGVIVMDPYTVATLMRYGGPVDIPGLGVTVDADSAAQYILRDQYEFAVAGANEQRIDALDTLATVVLARLQAGSLPEMATIASDFAPLISERRLLAWTRDSQEQALFDDIGLLGTMPAMGDDAGFALALSNAGGNKIDVFLERDVDVQVLGSASGRELVATVDLLNTAPSSGLPAYVIGNLIDLPSGTSRLFVTMYGPSELTSVTVDGNRVRVEHQDEAGWTAHSYFVTIPPGRGVSIEARFALAPGATGVDAQPVLVEQPLANR